MVRAVHNAGGLETTLRLQLMCEVVDTRLDLCQSHENPHAEASPAAIAN